MKNRKLYIVALAPFVVGFIIGCFFDYEINAALFIDPKVNVFGQIFSSFMPLVNYIFFSMMAGMALYFFTAEKNKLNQITYIIFAIVFYGCAVYFTQDKVFSINGLGVFKGTEKYQWLAWVGCALIEGVFVYLGFLYGKHNNNKRAFYAGLLLTVAIVWALVPLTQLLKVIVKRPRFRTIGVINGSVFTNWWEPFNEQYEVIQQSYVENISEEFKSFPSGHTGEAALLMFALPFLSKLEPKLRNKETLAFFIGFVYTLLMALSRMTMGAHYLTDICVGALLTIVCCIIANEINVKRHLDRKEFKFKS